METDISKKINFNVLILYQGDAATTYREHVAELISIISQKNNYARISPILIGGVGDSFNVETYDSLCKCLKNSDIAIAIVTEDPRPASIAGNLWFEIGLWCGKNSEKSILVLIQTQPNDYDEFNHGPFPVNPPSNLLSKSAPRFRTKDDMDAVISTFINEKINEKVRLLEKTLEKCESKIFGTIAKGCDKQKIDILFECANGNGYCAENKLHLYCLISELMRMEESSGECFIIQNSLFNIGKAINRLFQDGLYSSFNWAYKKIAIKEQIKVLRVYLERLVININNIFVRLKYRDNLEVWDRFNFYCSYRLDLAIKLHKNGRPFQSDLICKEGYKKITNFIEWAKDFLDGSERYIDAMFDSNANRINVMADKMFESGNFASDMSDLMDDIYSDNFIHYLSSLKSNEIVINDPEKPIEELTKIIEKLPHNLSNGRFPKIWSGEEP